MANRTRIPLEDRFWPKVDKNGPIPDYAPHLGQCWIWTGCITKGGYGQINSGGKHGRILAAHRVSYEIANGPLPHGDRSHHVDHLCRVTACCNPAHLEYVPVAVNALRGVGAQVARDRCATQTHCVNDHEFTPENTYIRQGTKTQRICRACQRDRMRRYMQRKRAA